MTDKVLGLKVADKVLSRRRAAIGVLDYRSYVTNDQCSMTNEYPMLKPQWANLWRRDAQIGHYWSLVIGHCIGGHRVSGCRIFLRRVSI
jgi:hypothetical protein